MQSRKRWIWIIEHLTLIAGCSVANDPQTSKTSAESLVITAGTRVNIEGILDYGATVFETNPTTLLEASDFHGYEFAGKAGGTVTITATGSSCGAPDTVLDLFGPPNANGNRGFQLVDNNDANLSPCSLDSKISNFTLPVDGIYLLVVTSFLQQGGGANGHYRLTLNCTNGACALPGAPNAATMRVNQSNIESGGLSAEDLFDIGDFTFEHVFTVAEGLGNALPAAPGNGTARPAFRNLPNNVHFAAFGAPEAQSCVTCHNIGGDDGAGDVNHNIFQRGDGINRPSGLPRNPPTVLGNGLRQRVGEEMTTDLQNELADARSKASLTNMAVTQALTSKGISFGSLVANPDNTVNYAGVVGVDNDLIIKPFGWKGREATLRQFVEDEFWVHFGMQSGPKVASKCPNFNLCGTSPVPDPDGDGVVDEITEGQLTTMAIYMGLRETPVRVLAISPAAQTRTNSGETLFNQVGCASCHRQFMEIKVPVHTEPGITIDLCTETHDPKPPCNPTMIIEVFSDFKRHDVGVELADPKDFNQIKANQFITPPLWGISVSAPYLHDGRARTLQDAILQHAGDATTVRNNFAALTADQQSQIVEFLLTLGRAEQVGAAKVDISNFLLQQVKQGTNIVLTQFVFPGSTLVPHGGRVIVARNATPAQFQSFYGRTLDANTLFFNSGNVFPTISGGEQFAISDSNNSATTNGVVVDGFTFPEGASAGQTLQRKDCGLISTQSASWNIVPSTPASATPGVAPLSTGQNRICITEVADSPTNSNFEFIELFVE